MAASHIKCVISVDDPNDPEHKVNGTLTIRADLLSLPPGRKRDAGWAITMQRVGETFTRAYHLACQDGD